MQIRKYERSNRSQPIMILRYSNNIHINSNVSSLIRKLISIKKGKKYSILRNCAFCLIAKFSRPSLSCSYLLNCSIHYQKFWSKKNINIRNNSEEFRGNESYGFDSPSLEIKQWLKALMADSIADIKTQHIRSNILYCNNAINIVIESVLVSLNKYCIQ